MKLVFVLLHYENKSETISCLESLFQYCHSESAKVEIVVVDNGSTKERLSTEDFYFKEKDFIHLIISDKNLGFAKGNNLGFEYAKNKLKANMIILSNSDIIYSQVDFVNKLIEDYRIEDFDIAGPKIIRVEDGVNQNPSPVIYHNSFDVVKKIAKFSILYLLSFFNMDLKVRRRPEKYDFHTENNTEFQLHGACLIFGENYIKNYDGLYEKTFMYGEESILKYISERDSLKMVYLDNIEINHLEGVSVASVYGKGKRNRRFYYKWNAHSCYLLLKLMIGS